MYLIHNEVDQSVAVSLKGHLLAVEAKMEQKSDDGQRRFYQEVCREYLLPDKLELRNLTSILGDDGILRIEAPLPPEAVKENKKPLQIPIQRDAATAKLEEPGKK